MSHLTVLTHILTNSQFRTISNELIQWSNNHTNDPIIYYLLFFHLIFLCNIRALGMVIMNKARGSFLGTLTFRKITITFLCIFQLNFTVFIADRCSKYAVSCSPRTMSWCRRWGWRRSRAAPGHTTSCPPAGTGPLCSRGMMRRSSDNLSVCFVLSSFICYVNDLRTGAKLWKKGNMQSMQASVASVCCCF